MEYAKKKKMWIIDKQTADLLKDYEKGLIEPKVREREVVKVVYKPIQNILRQDPRFGVTKVIFNRPATIVMWTDGTKTVVKCNNEEFDEEKGLAMAICKKVMGNKGNYYRVIKTLLDNAEGRVTESEVEFEIKQPKKAKGEAND